MGSSNGKCISNTTCVHGCTKFIPQEHSDTNICVTCHHPKSDHRLICAACDGKGNVKVPCRLSVNKEICPIRKCDRCHGNESWSDTCRWSCVGAGTTRRCESRSFFNWNHDPTKFYGNTGNSASEDYWYTCNGCQSILSACEMCKSVGKLIHEQCNGRGHVFETCGKCHGDSFVVVT